MTTTGIAFSPSLSVIAVEAVAEAVAFPLTVTVAEKSLSVGVMVMLELITLVSYSSTVGSNAVFNVPTLILRSARSAFGEFTLKVTVPEKGSLFAS
ncbi:hypothetical protein D3C85_1331000 [compost metagenome]